MSNLIQEIEEELQIEKSLKFFSKYYIIIILLIISILIIVSMNVFRNKNQIKNDEIAATNYNKIFNKIEKKDYSNIVEELDYIIKNNQSGYYIISNLNKAAFLLKKSKIKEAIEVYDTLVSNKKIDLAIKSIAKLNSLSIMMKNENSDNITKTVDNFDSNNPFYISSMMIKLDYLIATRNYDEAIITANNISLDQRSNQNIKKKMKIISNILKNN